MNVEVTVEIVSMVHSVLLVCVLSFGFSLKFDGPAFCARVSIGLDLG